MLKLEKIQTSHENYENYENYDLLTCHDPKYFHPYKGLQGLHPYFYLLLSKIGLHNLGSTSRESPLIIYLYIWCSSLCEDVDIR